MTTLKVLFWICLFLVVYTYVGYGVLLWLLVKLKRLFKGKAAPLAMPQEDSLPHVTFLVCAFNEQDVVEMKMENTRQLDYPKNKLHIMWVTDGSTDNTNNLLKTYEDVEIVYSPERRGKTAALNHGLSKVTSEITVMTDANTLVNRESLRNIILLFQDPKVGCVAGEKRILVRQDGKTAAQGEGLYWRYESTLKMLDSELYCIAYAPEAYAMEYGSADLYEESKRKRRIAAGGLQSSWWLRHMMNPFRRFIVAFQFVSHRVLRWTITPFALMALIPLNVLLVFMNAGTIYTLLWILQVIFYLAAFCGYYMEQHGKKSKLLYVPYYFLFMNLNVFYGISYLKSHQHAGTWEKAKRA